MSTSRPASTDLLRATLADVAPRLALADNLNGSNDWRDLYFLLDYIGFAVDRAYPEIPCSKGCSHCCHNQVFRVTRTEWEALRPGLAEWAPETRERVLAINQERFGPHRASLVAIAEAWERGESAPDAPVQTTPRSCPLLVAGRCSVYATRPAICRGFGYFTAPFEGTPALLICHQEGPAWIRQLEAAGVEQLPMPNWQPVQRQLTALNPSGEIKPLPLWLLEEGAG